MSLDVTCSSLSTEHVQLLTSPPVFSCVRELNVSLCSPGFVSSFIKWRNLWWLTCLHKLETQGYNIKQPVRKVYRCVRQWFMKTSACRVSVKRYHLLSESMCSQEESPESQSAAIGLWFCDTLIKSVCAHLSSDKMLAFGNPTEISVYRRILGWMY